MLLPDPERTFCLIFATEINLYLVQESHSGGLFLSCFVKGANTTVPGI